MPKNCCAKCFPVEVHHNSINVAENDELLRRIRDRFWRKTTCPLLSHFHNLTLLFVSTSNMQKYGIWCVKLASNQRQLAKSSLNVVFYSCCVNLTNLCFYLKRPDAPNLNNCHLILKFSWRIQSHLPNLKKIGMILYLEANNR